MKTIHALQDVQNKVRKAGKLDSIYLKSASKEVSEINPVLNLWHFYLNFMCIRGTVFGGYFAQHCTFRCPITSTTTTREPLQTHLTLFMFVLDTYRHIRTCAIKNIQYPIWVNREIVFILRQVQSLKSYDYAASRIGNIYFFLFILTRFGF